ncbi:MAG: hypothetical protein CFE43_03305 [Burkholderiales bacterium PBB3]|nr:MAG: hypothetical protein CFE43_03305 [Burkholderiales bacterium PBB3]
MLNLSKFGAVVALAGVFTHANALAKDTAPNKTTVASTTSSACGSKPLVTYTLGPRKDIDALYPAIATASQSRYDRSMAVASSIQFYLQNSLRRDLITDACGLTVTPQGTTGYQVSFQSDNPHAASYGATQSAWLIRAALALKGIQACQNSQDSACWQPKGSGLACSGPWQFYLPLGLPMLSQKAVMLLHYPPYSALQQSDYLNNATLNRWQRLLTTVGVAPADWTLYTTTVDIFPIAAPGSGQTGCFPTTNAVRYFGAPGSGYIPSMLGALVDPPVGNTTPSATRPVIVFGGEALGYWNAAYPQAPVAVLKAGSVNLNPAEPKKMTAYIGANHPIAAVYQTCTSSPGITVMAGQDLATACFAKTMGDTPDADPVAVGASCQRAYNQPKADSDQATQLCTTAVIDKSPQFAPWGKSQALAWCAQHSNQVCPLPDYATQP